jgi:hypothetical protein
MPMVIASQMPVMLSACSVFFSVRLVSHVSSDEKNFGNKKVETGVHHKIWVFSFRMNPKELLKKRRVLIPLFKRGGTLYVPLDKGFILKDSP